MKTPFQTKIPIGIVMSVVLIGSFLLTAAALAQPVDWNTAVNDNEEAPDGRPGSTFFSYNQPSMNDDGMIVFRARTRVGTGSSVTSGIYRLDLFGGAIERLHVRGDAVPDPNNTLVNGELAVFNDFPSTPRIPQRHARRVARPACASLD